MIGLCWQVVSLKLDQARLFHGCSWNSYQVSPVLRYVQFLNMQFQILSSCLRMQGFPHVYISSLIISYVREKI